MDLCAGMARFLADVSAIAPTKGSSDGSITALRNDYNAMASRFARPRPDGLVVEDCTVPAEPYCVPIRIYRPANATAPASCIVYMHGGGWVVGSIDTHDCVTAEIAVATGAVVISIDYRLAPEHPYPAAFEDCRHVLEYICRNARRMRIDPGCLIAAGDSAGANLAAALALWSRDVGAAGLKGQALVYPVLGTDFALSSYSENAYAPMLTTRDMQQYWAHYLAGINPAEDPYVAPLMAHDLTGLAPALILTARHDPVRDDGAVYGERLKQAGVPVSYRCAEGLAHGYLRARAHSPEAADEFAGLCEGVTRLLSA